MTARCAFYLRISLDRTGEHLAVDRQREDCRKLAAHHGWEVVGEFVDNSVSASDARKVRPGYDALVGAYEAGEFDALVCYDLDRLTRQPRQLEDWIDAATDRGLRIVTTNGEADLGTDGGRMYARIKASVARAEIERKSARQTTALRQRAEKGRAPSGVRLSGYAQDGTVIDAEAVIVREMFDRFLAGDSLRGIASAFQARGEVTRSGRPWNPSSVRTTLLNPRYAGLSAYRGDIVEVDGERVRGTWQAVISGATFDAVQQKLNDPARVTNREGTDRKHLGSGVYRCAHANCDVRLRGWSGGRYRCQHGHVNRSRGPVDEYVIEAVRKRLSRPDLADLLAADNTEEALALTDEIKDLRTRLRVIESDYDEGVIDGRRYAQAAAKVQGRLDDAQAKRATLAVGAAVSRIFTAPDPVQAFDKASLGERRTVLDALMSVSLSKGHHGSRTFDPETVKITWK